MATTICTTNKNTSDANHACSHCTRVFIDLKKLNTHTPDCFRKHAANPPERKCSTCGEDYTRKSGSAYRTHIKKCEKASESDDKSKTESASKQSDRRKKNLVFACCEHCNKTFENITVGQFGDHRYKCKKKIPNYNKDYQKMYRDQMKELLAFAKSKYPTYSDEETKRICRSLRKLKNDTPLLSNEASLQKLLENTNGEKQLQKTT